MAKIVFEKLTIRESGNVRAATESSRFDLINPALLKTVEKAQPANPDLVTLINSQQNFAINA